MKNYIIEKLKSANLPHAENDVYGLLKYFERLLEQKIDTITKIEKARKDKTDVFEWISVEERLPKEYTTVICFCGYDHNFKLDYLENGEWVSFSEYEPEYWSYIPHPTARLPE